MAFVHVEHVAVAIFKLVVDCVVSGQECSLLEISPFIKAYRHFVRPQHVQINRLAVAGRLHVRQQSLQKKRSNAKPAVLLCNANAEYISDLCVVWKAFVEYEKVLAVASHFAAYLGDYDADDFGLARGRQRVEALT